MVIFDVGQTTKAISIAVRGDTIDEPNETFAINLTYPTNLKIVDAQGICTIIDDDEAPRVSINNVTKSEGNKKTTSFTFTVSLSAPSSTAITVDYATANGSATAGSDYQGKTGTLTFAPGETTKTITILVSADRTVESNETFYVDLSGVSSNALIGVGRGIGTILNDDRLRRV